MLERVLFTILKFSAKSIQEDIPKGVYEKMGF